MDLTPYLDGIAADLDRATALADDRTRDVAHRLVSALEPGLRLALVRAVSDTAAAVARELDEAVVTVTMAGTEPVVTVTRTPPPTSHEPDRPALPADDDGDGGAARITLRLPDQLKTRAEELAASSGQSLNTWLVHTVRRATAQGRDGIPPTTPGSRRVSGWA
ncbi:toxin-antitoxin system HicB family antitoxin [Ornithinimicrobium cerasi]|uniref:toxin-antitoxin system HicB family antitoxin n=1 Tax=Ornithinimicrobium cerasi TaxID=2248773 RepID=UPI000EFDD3E4|nr:toxin-antitoxin system HicB family antitoxin [Ornithinimicrobium cerasi]